MENQLIKCPKCASTQIHASKKGFNIGKAALGTLAGGVLLGAVTGSVNRNKIILTCLKCGNKFKIGEKQKPNYEQMPINWTAVIIGSLIMIPLLALFFKLVLG